MWRAAFVIALALALVACSRTPDGGEVGTSARGIEPSDWELVSIGGRDVLGAGGRRATLLFSESDTTAGGFAGCNRWTSRYTRAGDSLTFAAPISTKMFCEDGMELETAFLGMIQSVRGYRQTDSTLTLLAGDSVLATFRPTAG